jgi:hypothetical protein
MRHLKSVLAVIGAAAVLVLAANTVTMAATGQGFLLGKTNTAGAVSTLQRTTDGPALKLDVKNPASAPLITDGKGKVSNLNADSVDGYNSTSLRNRTYVFTSVFADKSSVAYNLPVSNGSYIVTVSNFFSGIGSTGLQCFVADDDVSVITGWDAQNYVNNDDWKPAVSATGYGTKSDGADLWVVCGVDTGTWSSSSSQPLTITATQTDIVKQAELAPGTLPFKIKVPK